MSEYLTWDDLADIYHKETGKHARIQPMENIYNWAVERKDLFDTSDKEGRIKRRRS